MLGKRRGFPSEITPPHSPVLTMMGAAMLWVGWFGFNAGSALTSDGAAGMAMTVTHISAADGLAGLDGPGMDALSASPAWSASSPAWWRGSRR